jgi:hypothetical protein
MGVSTETRIKFYTKEKALVNTYCMDDRSDDYIYSGLVCDGGAVFNPDSFGDFTAEQKEIMKIYFDEESMSVGEEYASVTSNIQAPEKLLPIWNQIRTAVIKPFQAGLNDYHNGIIADYEKLNKSFEKNKNARTRLFSKKEHVVIPDLLPLKSEYDFKDTLWRTIWKIDSISKVIALLIVAKKNNMLVEITAADF